jgi:hypothetical protein
MSDDELLTEAKQIEAELVKGGDPFDGRDWSLVQILRAFIRVQAEAELYRRGYDLMGAADISEYLAKCETCGAS